jgi:ABC-type branched-subunit amino acid transport system substrate-binding protein
MHVVWDSRRHVGGRKPWLVFSVAFSLVLGSLMTLSACAVLRPVRPVVKIGLVGPFVGQYRYAGYDALYGAQLAVRQANSAGGVAGFGLELVAYDDQGNAATAYTSARNLALDPQVISVIGHFRDETTATAQQLYKQVGLLHLSAGTVEGQAGMQNELYCTLFEYLKGFFAREEGGANLRVQWISDSGADRVALECSEGIEMAVGARIPPPSDVDVVVLDLDPVAAGESLMALRRAGWDGVVAGGPALGSPLFAQFLADQIAGPASVVFVSPLRWPDAEGRDAEFAADYRSLGPHIPSPGPFSIASYETTQALVSAIEAVVHRGEAPTRQSLAEYLIQQPVSSVYVYRWEPTGGLELLNETVVEFAPAE